MHTWPVRSPTETAATPIAFIRAIVLAAIDDGSDDKKSTDK